MKSKKKTFRVVRHLEIDRAVSEYFGWEYECVIDMEWWNDTYYSISVSKKMLGDYHLSKVARFVAGKSVERVLGSLLNQMCNDGAIKPGEYLIHVSW